MQTAISEANQIRVNKLKQFYCQICQDSQGNKIICNSCFLICCNNCKQNHLCIQLQSDYSKKQQHLHSLQPTGQILTYKALVLLEKDIVQQKIIDFQSKRDQQCQRCLTSNAAIQCLGCKIRYLCEICFKDIHSQPKMSRHKHLKINNQDRFKHNNFKYSHHKQKDTILDSKGKKQRHLAQVNQDIYLSSLQANIQIIKNAMILQQTIHQNNVVELLKGYQALLEQLVSQTKQKLKQITATITLNSKKSQAFYTILSEQLKREESSLSNIIILHQFQEKFNFPKLFIDQKISKCQQSIRKIANKLSQNSSSQLSVDLLLKAFSNQTMIIEEIIDKIQTKSINFSFQFQNKSQDYFNKSSCYQRENSHQKYQKINKKSLNHFSNQSKNKVITQTNVISPKRSQRNSVINQGDIHNLAAKPLNEESRLKQFNCQRLIQIENTIYFNDLTSHKIQRNRVSKSSEKIMVEDTLKSPKMSLKGTSRFKENNDYYGINHCNPKKTRKQLKNEVIQPRYGLTDGQAKQPFIGKK